MNLPNQLTCLRVALAAAFMIFLASPEAVFKIMALPVFLAASLTDYWDGRLARKLGQVTQFGKIMDPIADKLLTFSAFVMFVKMALVPAWGVVLIVMRDLLVTCARFRMPKGSTQEARLSGKHKTVMQFIFIVAVLLFIALREMRFWNAAWTPVTMQTIRWMMLGVVAMTLWSGWRYLAKSRDFLMGQKSD